VLPELEASNIWNLVLESHLGELRRLKEVIFFSGKPGTTPLMSFGEELLVFLHYIPERSEHVADLSKCFVERL
jgi:hypothetical protein